jgi:type IV secretion system protein VirB1
MCLIGKAIYRGSCYCSVTIATARGRFCRNKDDQGAAGQVSKRPIFPPFSERVNASSALMFSFGPVVVGPPSGHRLSTTRSLLASPGYAGIIPGWQPKMASPKSSNLSTGCCARFVNWDIKDQSHSMMRVIRAARRNPRVPLSVGRETNRRNSVPRRSRLFEARGLILAAGTAWLAFVPGAALATSVSPTDFAALAARCAPAVSAQTLAAVARTESAFDPWALHDNTTRLSENPGNGRAALADASAWVARGDSVDIGMMQINSANLPALNMTVVSALDPCVSLAGGAEVLQAAFGNGDTSPDAQVALLLALSRYNTGSPLKGIMNGYARKVMAYAGSTSLSAPSVALNALPAADPNAPPSWDVSATGAYAQSHGAPWLIPLAPGPGTPKQSVGRPAPAQAPETLVATNKASSSIQPTTRSQ